MARKSPFDTTYLMHIFIFFNKITMQLANLLHVLNRHSRSTVRITPFTRSPMGMTFVMGGSGALDL